MFESRLKFFSRERVLTFLNSSRTCENVVELLILSMIAQMVLWYFFNRALGMESHLGFVVFKEWEMLFTSSLVIGENNQK